MNEYILTKQFIMNKNIQIELFNKFIILKPNYAYELILNICNYYKEKTLFHIHNIYPFIIIPYLYNIKSIKKKIYISKCSIYIKILNTINKILMSTAR